jgi:geranylgeranyl reductase family protein
VERADVLIVGGGPAGSACARALASEGRDVVVVDAAEFPRDKPCAGWITPEVLDELPFSIASYAKDHVAQPIERFRLGKIDGGAVEVDYGTPVSYGIRRCEFDAELLGRSGARVNGGVRIRTIERDRRGWVLNGAFAAPVLVGAGGHFCPIARHLSGPPDEAALVVAREIEFPLSADEAASSAVEGERPELYFCSDLRGYGWCFRKNNYLNIGLGRLDPRHLSEHLDAFLAFLRRRQRIGRVPDEGWRGHAYRIRAGRGGPLSGEGIVLVGDAAGLAAPASGEGILSALVSGRIAGESIRDSKIAEYEARLERRFGPRGSSRRLPDRIASVVGAAFVALPGFARHFVLDRWFLHRSGSHRRPAFSS